MTWWNTLWCFRDTLKHEFWNSAWCFRSVSFGLEISHKLVIVHVVDTCILRFYAHEGDTCNAREMLLMAIVWEQLQIILMKITLYFVIKYFSLKILVRQQTQENNILMVACEMAHERYIKMKEYQFCTIYHI